MVNDRIKALRKTLGLSQAEFGEKVGVSRSVIVNAELDRAKTKELLLRHICEVFNVNDDWLLDGRGDMFVGGEPPNKMTDEIVRLYETLKPEFQEYALKQITQLLELQGKPEE